jgi:DNA primase small subunit
MDENSTLTVRRYFKEYYFRHGSRITPPSQIEAREFGYLPFGGVMVRHLAFKDIGELRAVLVREVPAGVYCSNSLYEDPTGEMHLKGWKKAELIFDVDADALKQPCKKVHDIWLCKGCGKREFGPRPTVCPNCKSNRLLELSWACSTCLLAAKNETFRLIDFLEFDFGIARKQIRIFFSGNAGYHISIEGSAYETLDTHARAEIADYLSGRGLDPSLFLTEKLTPVDPGWRGRMARYVRDLPADDKTFKSGSSYERRLGEMVNDFSKKQLASFFDRFLSETAVRIDSMVTTDVHRIFRMPETLNNKTGLVKRECSSNLADFDPMVEAIALKGEEQKARVFVDMCPKVELGGRSYGPFKSETKELPLCLVVYIVCKGAGKVVSEEKQGGAALEEEEKALSNE